MLTKILITAAVIVFALFMQRLKTRRAQEIPVVRPPPVVKPKPPMPKGVRPAAYGFALLVVLSAVSAYYLSWAEDQQVVTIRIINTVSGEVVTYRAHRGDIDGRKFTTTDGLTVRMADADRFEVLEANDG